MLGKTTEDTPPARLNICLVSERVAVPPQENIPEIEQSQDDDDDDDDDDDAHSSKQQATPMSESDVVDLFASTEELKSFPQ